MMTAFPDYIRQRLDASGYERIVQQANDVFAFDPDEAKMIWVCYLEAEITPEQIRRCFDFPGHVLFVVKESLIPQELVSRQDTPMWLRVLHGLYMGRVYVWNDRYLFGLHFDYDTGDVSESGIIQPDDLLLVETGTWLRGWPGTYKLARFYDRAWWNEYVTGDYGGRRTNENYQNDGYKAWQDQARERERSQQQQDDSSGYQYDPNDWPGGKPPKPPPFTQDKAKRDFMREFMACGNLAAAKALYRKLAKEFHPDLNPGKDTTVEMQQVNVAYERAERLWK